MKKMDEKYIPAFANWYSNGIPYELFYCIYKSLHEVYLNHSYLIGNGIHERSIVFWFGIYFYQCLQKTRYRECNFDFEYNKNLDNVKRTETFLNGTYPDLILHKRETNTYNILVLEFKTWWNDDSDRDIEKLKDFLNQDREYRYKFGAFVRFERERPEVMIIRGETE